MRKYLRDFLICRSKVMLRRKYFAEVLFSLTLETVLTNCWGSISVLVKLWLKLLILISRNGFTRVQQKVSTKGLFWCLTLLVEKSLIFWNGTFLCPIEYSTFCLMRLRESSSFSIKFRYNMWNWQRIVTLACSS